MIRNTQERIIQIYWMNHPEALEGHPDKNCLDLNYPDTFPEEIRKVDFAKLLIDDQSDPSDRQSCFLSHGDYIFPGEIFITRI